MEFITLMAIMRINYFLLTNTTLPHTKRIFDGIGEIPTGFLTQRNETFVGKWLEMEANINKSMTYYELDNAEDWNEITFNYRPEVKGKKSRLELSSCYTRPQNFKTLKNISESSIYNKTTKKSLGTIMESLLKGCCAGANQPIENVYTYSFDMKISKGVNSTARYVIAQWHGSPDPRILKSKDGIVARVTTKDLFSVCTDFQCKQGKIQRNAHRYFNISSKLSYQKGGYPPLALKLDHGFIKVVARSDDRIFIPRGGCFVSGEKQCKDYPHQQAHLLFQRNASFLETNFNRFSWKIKWSEYKNTFNQTTSRYEGSLYKNATISLFINDEKVIDWTGPCGRNDDGRIPYFKFGVYNPSGRTTEMRIHYRNVTIESET